jgi:hypothetical protein
VRQITADGLLAKAFLPAKSSILVWHIILAIGTLLLVGNVSFVPSVFMAAGEIRGAINYCRALLAENALGAIRNFLLPSKDFWVLHLYKIKLAKSKIQSK